ncbi:MAG: gliding motility protein GldN [Bacteroidaceae bacterium]|jgi:gliding motility associated protien GldN|nr:gliding motility protein GldN [Bacteroidaceae bacterium]
MKRIYLAFIIALLVVPAVAQPPARMREAQKKATQEKQQQAVGVSERAQLEYPTAPTMPEDVAWRRDLYCVIDLQKDKNAVLYYPQEPQGDQMNLFTFLFKLVMHHQIKAYDYTIDGNESFKSTNVLLPKDILDRHHIRYESKGDQFRIEDSDIPSADVRSYYIKESTYYDQNTASFHTQITAICPVREEADEFGGAAAKYPMFWLKYEDIAPYLAKLSLMASNYNNAATISADDYFSTHQYEAKVYKTTNLQGKVIANNDSAMKLEQTRIAKELVTLENHVWGTDSSEWKKDSLNNTTQTKPIKTVRRTNNKKNEDVSTSSRSQLKRQKSEGSSSSGSSRPRISVRRQRH